MAGTSGPDADRWLGDAIREITQLAGRPVRDTVRGLRPIVRRTMLAYLPDGSTPDTALVQEIIGVVVDVVDAAPAGRPDAALAPDDARWLDACRQYVHSILLLDDTLEGLHRENPPPAPTYGTLHRPTRCER